ncbi:hypothetical protein BM536_007155 [Streptomyces phaeoluteigriseus]|uniref:Uncharacterized protein n=1 Tax=Streptomyces phaeoluteigriseus TaxID=114686 RepID=A0A1V6MWB2_9ACTN|nr:hypothetical protein BM536_007155 [Streptomyces phaeoluteigriseus]
MPCGLAYAALALLDQDTGPVQAPVVMVPARRWWQRHRDWAAGAAAGLVGSLVVFALLGPLRAHLDRLARRPARSPPADSVGLAGGHGRTSTFRRLRSSMAL